jgi:hypothetical protein
VPTVDVNEKPALAATFAHVEIAAAAIWLAGTPAPGLSDAIVTEGAAGTVGVLAPAATPPVAATMTATIPAAADNAPPSRPFDEKNTIFSCPATTRGEHRHRQRSRTASARPR